MQITPSLDQIQAASITQLEKYVNDLGVAIASLQKHVHTYPDDQENSQALRLEMNQFATIRKALNIVLAERYLANVMQVSSPLRHVA